MRLYMQFSSSCDITLQYSTPDLKSLLNVEIILLFTTCVYACEKNGIIKTKTLGGVVLRAVIITNGYIGNPKVYKHFFKENDLIVCADGGYRHCKQLNITPSLVLGDFDSLPQGFIDELENNNIPTQQFPIKKDFTDTELAVNHVLMQGADEIVLLGGTGSRIDHSFANIMLLAALAQRGIKVRLVDDQNDCSFITDSIIINARCGDFVSLIPVTPEVLIKRTEGLHYPLHDHVLKMGSTLGVSNILDQIPGYVEISSGLLMVAVTRD